MKSTYTLTNAIIGLAVATQLSCTDHDLDTSAFNDDPSVMTVNGTWRVVCFEDLSAKTIEYQNEENSWGFDIIVTFDDKKDPHVVFGQNTTNAIAGKFDYVGSRQIKCYNVASTFVNQPRWADEFNRATDGENRFKIDHTRLCIYYDNGTRSVTMIKQ